MRFERRQATVLVSGAVAVVAIAMACTMTLVPHQGAIHVSSENLPITEFLPDEGEAGSIDRWLSTLSDEGRASVDIAYESSVSDGYKGSKAEWVRRRVLARHDQNGDLVVILPDGGEFVVPSRSLEATAGDGGSAVKDGKRPAADGKEEVASTSASSSKTGHRSGSSSGSGSSESPSQGESPVPLLSADTVDARPGDSRVAVTVSLENNPGILGMTLSVSYDEKALTLVGAENGAALRGVLSLTHSRTYKSGCLFTWHGVELGDGDVRDGTVLTLYFDVANGAQAGLRFVAVRSVGSAFGNSLEEIGMAVQDGGVVVG